MGRLLGIGFDEGGEICYFTGGQVQRFTPAKEFKDGEGTFAGLYLGNKSLVPAKNRTQIVLRNSETLSVFGKSLPEFFIECFLSHILKVAKILLAC
jgi:hypothetical protein